MPDRTACKYCGKLGFIRRENIIKAGRTITAFYCGACNRSWEVSGDDTDGKVENRSRDQKRGRS
jgi:hypothetical protein